MQRLSLRIFRLLICVVMSSRIVSGQAADDEKTSDSRIEYDQQIRPLLLQKCAACHGALKQSAGLRLDAGELIRKGGDSGPVIEVGNAARSLLIERVATEDHAVRMPPEGQGEKLTTAQIEILQKWISEGAQSPEDEKIPEDPAKYWSYQSPRVPDIPSVRNSEWVRNPIDAFIAAEHERHGLVPSAEAPREVWLRRVTLDLTGLPPTRAELQSFMADDSDKACEKVVDRLLASPQYGERWGRHWMDVWRYSDWYGSRGINEIRYSQRHIWRWRDWIVESLNTDKPYDRMITEMLAGDEYAAADPETLRATGFLGRNWYKFDRNVWMFDTVEHTSQAFLGLTLKCARCHDHKFDPVSQEDYYHFRAFFEPHDVRTDPISGNEDTEKDATLGAVLKEGVARVFDKTAEARTYVFERGDNRYPVEARVMEPAVPRALGTLSGQITPIHLPAEAWYPALRPAVSEGLLAAAKSRVQTAETEVIRAQEDSILAENAVKNFQARLASGSAEESGSPEPAVVLHDNFAAKSDVWTVVSGNWTWQDGKLTETSVGNFATITASSTLPRNFHALVRYRTLQPGSFRSVGFSFDYVDQGNSQDIYTSTNDTSQSVQAFHRDKGQQVYPQAGIVRTGLMVGEETTVEITVRDQQLALKLNGDHKLDYVMPISRRDGRFALWVHNGSAEFLEVKILELVPDLNELKHRHLSSVHRLAAAKARLSTAVSEQDSLRARIAAEKVRYSDPSSEATQTTAMAASRAERQATAAHLEEKVLIAKQLVETIEISVSGTESAATEASVKALEDARTSLNAAEQKLTEAIAAVESADGTYTPLGKTFPQTSTGRRLALAQWITQSENPRTSRVAVNHIWLRHFGEALVPSVANFGLNGRQPSHPELLDWLAGELTRQGWKMKPLHRMIVLSAAYRQTSATPVTFPRDQVMLNKTESNITIDPANKFLWRMNSRRMEAEAVRDSVLAVAGRLDLSSGGPEISESESQTTLRRSLYFRITPNERAELLGTFDSANPNECYRRQESVVPQQALAMMNSRLSLESARLLAGKLNNECGEQDDETTRATFLTLAFETILSRAPTVPEVSACEAFLARATETAGQSGTAVFPPGDQSTSIQGSTVPHLRARENLVHVLLSHNDFVTIR